MPEAVSTFSIFSHGNYFNENQFEILDRWGNRSLYSHGLHEAALKALNYLFFPMLWLIVQLGKTF